jgi:hypothetical protein
LPAIERGENNTEGWQRNQWYVNGGLHRENDLPAIEYVNGDKEWYKNGFLHRSSDLPAVIHGKRERRWYMHNQPHRLGGLPAIIFSGGTEHWHIYGKQYTYEQVINYYKILTIFGKYCLKKIRMRKLRRLRWIHGELLCMPSKGSYPGGQDYHQMISYFMNL